MNYFALAALEITLLGLLSGVVGTLIVLRRRSFFAVALSHATFPGGVVFASSPDAQRWVWNDYTHRRPFTRKAFRLLFADQGWTVREVGYESVMPGTAIISARMPSNT